MCSLSSVSFCTQLMGPTPPTPRSIRAFSMIFRSSHSPPRPELLSNVTLDAALENQSNFRQKETWSCTREEASVGMLSEIASLGKGRSHPSQRAVTRGGTTTPWHRCGAGVSWSTCEFPCQQRRVDQQTPAYAHPVTVVNVGFSRHGSVPVVFVLVAYTINPPSFVKTKWSGFMPR